MQLRSKNKLTLKFTFSEKATKIDKIFTVDLMVDTYCQIDREDFVNFVAFSENVNFKVSLFLDRSCTIFSWLNFIQYIKSAENDYKLESTEDRATPI